MPNEKRIAILGGGAAGLSAAYFLHNRPSRDGREVYKCTVYEASSRLGGNCRSAYLETAYEEPFGDLGVNDFNTERYKNFMEVLGQLETNGFLVPHAPLIDTTTWYTPRDVRAQDARCYTDDDVTHWEAHPQKPWLKNIARDWDAFQGMAFKVLNDPSYAQMSVDQFVEEAGFSYDFAEYNLRARINGMYYVNDRSPGSMPLRAVMKYYHLQEGIGAEKRTAYRKALAQADGEPHLSSRHFFTRGASDWIRQLTRCLESRGVKFCLGESPVANLKRPSAVPDFQSGDPSQFDALWTVRAGENHIPEEFDHVISAVHADRVGRVIDDGLTARMVTSLSWFEYYNSIAIVHEDESVFPADPKAWSTYNILVYPPQSQRLRPYTISYVERKHHGQDSNRPPFVTLTPYDAVSDDKVRQMLDLPKKEKTLAVAQLRHNTLSWEAIAAQQALHREQGTNGLWFTGGWTNGAGLHEEVLAMSKEIASILRGIPQATEGYREGQLDVAPKHVRDSFEPDAHPFPDGFWDSLV